MAFKEIILRSNNWVMRDTSFLKIFIYFLPQIKIINVP